MLGSSFGPFNPLFRATRFCTMQKLITYLYAAGRVATYLSRHTSLRLYPDMELAYILFSPNIFPRAVKREGQYFTVPKSPSTIYMRAIQGEKRTHWQCVPLPVSTCTLRRYRNGICHRFSESNAPEYHLLNVRERPPSRSDYRISVSNMAFTSSLLPPRWANMIGLLVWHFLIGLACSLDWRKFNVRPAVNRHSSSVSLFNAVPQKAKTRQSIPTSSGLSRINLHCTITSVRWVRILRHLRRGLTSIIFRLQRSIMAAVRIPISLRKTIFIMVQNDSEHLTRLGYIPFIYVRLFSSSGSPVPTNYSVWSISHGGTCMFWVIFFSIVKIYSQLAQRHQL